MKKQFLYLIGILFISLLTSCTKEPAENTLNITVEKTDYISGDEVVFQVTGSADYLVFYDGLEASDYSNYPNAGSQTIPISSDNLTVSKTYNLHDTITATFIAASYGNWGEDEIIKQFDFTLTIRDNRTGFAGFILKTPGLSGKEFNGVINEENHTVNFNLPTGSSLTKLTNIYSTESALATVYLNGTVLKNKSVVDYSSQAVTLTVVAIDGTTEDWTIIINLN